MNSFTVGAGAFGGAVILALTITAPFGLLSEEPAPVSTTPPPFAEEGKPAWDVGIPAPTAEPKVFFANLADGATVSSPVTIEMGALGMRVGPAGEVVEGVGHHHLLINTSLSPEQMAEAIPVDDQHVHFGMGEKRVTLELPKGTHRLQLVAADGNHVPHQPPIMSRPITVTVR